MYFTIFIGDTKAVLPYPLPKLTTPDISCHDGIDLHDVLQTNQQHVVDHQ
jgi:hypothetical protein